MHHICGRALGHLWPPHSACLRPAPFLFCPETLIPALITLTVKGSGILVMIHHTGIFNQLEQIMDSVQTPCNRTPFLFLPRHSSLRCQPPYLAIHHGGVGRGYRAFPMARALSYNISTTAWILQFHESINHLSVALID